MRVLARLLAVFLCACLATYADGNSFDRVRYNGGSVDSKVDPKDWHKQTDHHVRGHHVVA
jgi:hypothetical protein